MFKNLKGLKFDRLLVLERAGKTKDNRALWKCLCDCGKEVIRRGKDLSSGETTSCGCKRVERNKVQAERLKTHGLSNSRTYTAWQNMKDRCSNPNNKAWVNYGGRGITFDPKWENFENFLTDLGECPEDLTLERTDVNGNYVKDNCVWISRKEQNRNTRKNIWLELEGQRKLLSDWSKELGIPIATLHRKLKIKSFIEICREYNKTK